MDLSSKLSILSKKIARLDDSINKFEDYAKIDKILNETETTSFWIKDRNFKFLRLNQATCNLMYDGCKPENLLNLTDWEYMQKIGCSQDIVEKVKTCCSLSDMCTMNSENVGENFYEKFTTKAGKEIWLLTTKEKIPPTIERDKIFGIYGTAIVFPIAERIIQSGIQELEKLSDSVYRIIEK